ncbi:MAG: DUF6949 family protein [Pseudomonadota bacterium]
MSAGSLHSLYVLMLGFSVAGALATGYQLLTARPASFNIFGDGTGAVAAAHVPFLVFAAPFIIIRDAITMRRPGSENFFPAMISTVVAGCWSLLSGKFVMVAVAALGMI